MDDIIGVVVLVVTNHLEVHLVGAVVYDVTLGVTIPLSALHNHALGESWQPFKRFLRVNHSQTVLDSFEQCFMNPGCVSACLDDAIS